jgi:hypothetical protein
VLDFSITERSLTFILFCREALSSMHRLGLLSFFVVPLFCNLAMREIRAGGPSENASLACPDVWEISTRHLTDRPRCIDPIDPNFRVHRVDSGCWQEARIEDALQLDGRLPIVYVHGNFMSYDNARQRVLLIDEILRARAQRSYRLIMLSWPSQREPHPLRDSRENAASSDCQSLYVAWVLQHLREAPQVSLLGFSLGARSISGGLHLAAGGTIRGLQYATGGDAEPSESLVRVGFVAPAVDRTWLMPSGKHRLAPQRVEGILSLYNSEDPVLQRYRFLEAGSHAVAAGYRGFVGNSLIQQYDCSGCVGRTHDERSYFRQCPYFGLVLDHLLWNESVGACRIP